MAVARAALCVVAARLRLLKPRASLVRATTSATVTRARTTARRSRQDNAAAAAAGHSRGTSTVSRMGAQQEKMQTGGSEEEEEEEEPPSLLKLRILCLHSFRTSAAILRDQLEMAQWPSSLGDLCEFTFMDSPHPASGDIPPDVASFFEPPYKEWWNATTTKRDDDDEKSGGGASLEYVGLDESLASL